MYFKIIVLIGLISLCKGGAHITVSDHGHFIDSVKYIMTIRLSLIV
jgi:hypothetical protein